MPSNIASQASPGEQSRTPPRPSGIAKIPADVLAEIFICFIQLCHSSGFSGTISWTSVIAVCSFWREVAFSSPGFWKYIRNEVGGSSNERAAKRNDFLEHAKGVPLVMKLLLDCEVQTLRDLLPRIGELEILIKVEESLTSHLDQSRLSEIFDLAWSKCQLSKLVIRNDVIRTRSKEASNHLEASGELIEVGSPSLNSLTLRRCFLPSESPIFNHLTELIISQLYGNDSLTMETLRGILDKSLNLKFLSLLEAGPRVKEFDSAETLSLPSIQELQFRGHVDMANNLFRSLIVPSTATWTSTILTNFEYTYRGIDKSLKLIPYPVAAHEVVEKIFIISMKKASVLLTSKLRLYDRPHSPVYNVLEIAPPNADTSTSNILLEHLPYILSRIGWAEDITTLWIDFEHEAAVETARGSGWVALLSSLPYLRTLHIRVDSVNQRHAAPAIMVSSLLSVLARHDAKAVRAADPFCISADLMDELEEALDTKQEEAKLGMLCPNLDYLDLKTRENFERTASVRALALWEPLVAAMRDRDAAGRRLRHLRITGRPPLSETALARLGQFVDDVATG